LTRLLPQSQWRGAPGRGAPKVRRFSPARKIGSFPRLAPAIRLRQIAVHARCASVCLSPLHRPRAPILFNRPPRGPIRGTRVTSANPLSRRGGRGSKYDLRASFQALARREPRSLEAAGTRCLWVSRESDWGGSRVEPRLRAPRPGAPLHHYYLVGEPRERLGRKPRRYLIYPSARSMSSALLSTLTVSLPARTSRARTSSFFRSASAAGGRGPFGARSRISPGSAPRS